MMVLFARVLWIFLGVSVATRTASRSQARSSTELLRADLRTWLQRGGASRLEAEEKAGEQSVDKLNDNNSQEDDTNDTNEKIIEALLVKQKRLEGENRALRKQLNEVQSHGNVPGASQELLAQLRAEKNQTAFLQAQDDAREKEILSLKQSLNKAKKALLQSVDGEAADSGASKEAQSQALSDARAENTRLAAKVREVEGRRQALQTSVSHLQGVLNMSLVAVNQAERQLSKDAGQAKDGALTAARQEIKQLQTENKKLKVAGHTLMEKFDELRATARR